MKQKLSEEKSVFRNPEASPHLKTSVRALRKGLLHIYTEGALPINAVNSVKLPSLAGDDAKMRVGKRKRRHEIHPKSLPFSMGCVHMLLHQSDDEQNQNVLYLSLSVLALFPHFSIYFTCTALYSRNTFLSFGSFVGVLSPCLAVPPHLRVSLR